MSEILLEELDPLSPMEEGPVFESLEGAAAEELGGVDPFDYEENVWNALIEKGLDAAERDLLGDDSLLPVDPLTSVETVEDEEEEL